MKISLRKTLVGVFALLVMVVFITAAGFLAPALACNYYASPSGGGNGLSSSSPFQISKFWSVAKPGTTLCLLDGTYTASTSMINPPKGLNGSSTGKITIKAVNDGKVLIHGQNARLPVRLEQNDWFIIQGINACCSSGDVIKLGNGADNNIVRRVVAWNAPSTTNHMVWSVHGNKGNLLEDVAGFGTGRKIFQWYNASGPLTIRRAWGRWERSTGIGPKMVYSLVYHGYKAIYENVIGTWDESSMGNTTVNQPYGILSMDSTYPDVCADAKYLGSIGYIRSVDKAASMIGVARSSNDTECLTFQDTVAYIQPGTKLHIKPFSLLNDPGTSTKKIAKYITEIGGASSLIQSQWKVSYRVDANSLTSSASIWKGSGAWVCTRYFNGSLTSQPLWPWPMNQRIINAMNAAGKTAVDVTKTMEQIFGPIPSECRSSSSTTTLAAPGNLVIR